MSEIKLYNRDCLEAMREMPDKAFDLAIVDPPYGIGVNHSMGRRKGDKPSNYKPAAWDRQPPSKEYFEELIRVSKNQIVWGANHFISRMPFDSSCWLMWDKKFSDQLSFAQYELAWTSFDGVCKKFDKDPKEVGRIHPTQKPVQLYKWILSLYAKEGMKVLDTHLGSGSIAIACYDLGYDLTGYETDPDHFANASKRLETHKKQLTIFPA